MQKNQQPFGHPQTLTGYRKNFNEFKTDEFMGGIACPGLFFTSGIATIVKENVADSDDASSLLLVISTFRIEPVF